MDHVDGIIQQHFPVILIKTALIGHRQRQSRQEQDEAGPVTRRAGRDHGTRGCGVVVAVMGAAVGTHHERARRRDEHGQHTEEILLELDVDWDQIAHAKDVKAIL